ACAACRSRGSSARPGGCTTPQSPSRPRYRWCSARATSRASPTSRCSGAIPETEQAIEEIQAARLPRLLLTPLHNVGDLRLRNGDLAQAEAAFREVIRLAAVYGF